MSTSSTSSSSHYHHHHHHHHHPHPRRHITKTSSYVNAGILSRLFFCHIASFLYQTYTWRNGDQCNISSLEQCPPNDRAEVTLDMLKRKWQCQLRSFNPKFWKAILATFGTRLIIPIGLVLYRECFLKLMQSLLLGRIVRYFSTTHHRSSISTEYWYTCYAAIALIIATLVHSFSAQHVTAYLMRLGMRVRTACVALIYQKSLRLSLAGVQDCGWMIDSLLNNDVNRFDDFSYLLPYLFVCPFQTTLTIAVIWSYCGMMTTLVMTLLLISFIPLHFVIARAYSWISFDITEMTNLRLRYLSEILAGIKLIKVYCWEQTFTDRVAETRRLEVHHLHKASYLQAFNLSILLTASRVVLLVCLIVALRTSIQTVTAEAVFVIIALLTTLRQTVTIHVPNAVNCLYQVNISCKRIQSFLMAEEVAFSFSSKLPEFSFAPNNEHEISTNDKETLTKKPKPTVATICRSSMELTTFTHEPLANIFLSYLRIEGFTTVRPNRVQMPNQSCPLMSEDEITIELIPGDLLAIVGPSKCGKSALLRTILKEDPSLSTSFDCTNRVDYYGTLAYISQNVWTLTDCTIRENILFGLPYNPIRYDHILTCCGLKHDLKHHFPFGDQTLIQNNHQTKVKQKNTLSIITASQKARIAIARALYRNSDIYLFDDILPMIASTEEEEEEEDNDDDRNNANDNDNDRNGGDKHCDKITVKLLFERCLLDHLGEKICVLVTNNMQFVEQATKVLILDNDGQCLAYGSQDEIQQMDIDFVDLLQTSTAPLVTSSGSVTTTTIATTTATATTTAAIDTRSSTITPTVGSFDYALSRLFQTSRKIQRKYSSFSSLSSTFGTSIDSGISSFLISFDTAEDRIELQRERSLGTQISKVIEDNGEDDFDHSTQTTSHLSSNVVPKKSNDDTNENDDGDGKDYDSGGNDADEDDEDDDDAGGCYQSNWTILVEYLKHSAMPNWLICTTFFSIFSQLLYHLSDVFLAHWISTFKPNKNNNNDNDDDDDDGWSKEMIIYGILIGMLSLITIIRGTTCLSVCIGASERLHQIVLAKLIRSPIWFFGCGFSTQSSFVASQRILTRFFTDLCVLDQKLPSVVYDLNLNTLQAVGYLAIICILLPYMIVPTIAIVTFIFIISRYYLRSAGYIKHLESTIQQPIYTHMTATLEGLDTIRSFHAQQWVEHKFLLYLNDHCAVWHTHICATRALALMLDCICTTYNALLLLVAMSLPVSSSNDDHHQQESEPTGHNNGGRIGLALICGLTLSTIVHWSVRQLVELRTQLLSAKRLMQYRYLRKEAKRRTSKSFRSTENWPTFGRIKFDHLYLNVDVDEISYHKMNTTTTRIGKKKAQLQLEPLINIDGFISGGEKIGILGQGSSKRTLVAALFRLIEPTSGAIRIDAVDIQSIGTDDLRQAIAFLPRRTLVFTGTIRFNLDPSGLYTDADLWAALERVQLAPLVKQLPDMLDAQLCGSGYGVAKTLSIDQQQLIGLARVLLRRNVVLIRDEATTNLYDKSNNVGYNQTKNMIDDIIKSELSHCTVLTVTNRISSIIDNDRVMVLEHGKIVEFDSPYKLLKERGKFFQLCRCAGARTFLHFHHIAKRTYLTKVRSLTATNIAVTREHCQQQQQQQQQQQNGCSVKASSLQMEH